MIRAYIVYISLLYLTVPSWAGTIFEPDEYSAALWDFRKVEKDKVTDESGFGNELRLEVLENGEKTFLKKNGVFFDGVGGYASVKKKPSLDISDSNFSIEAMLRFDDVSKINQVIIGNKPTSSGKGGFSLNFTSWKGKRFVFQYCRSGNPLELSSNPDPSIKTGEWYYLAVTFGEGDLTIWLDGERIAEAKGIETIDLSSQSPFRIGIYSNPWQRDGKGKLTNKMCFSGTIGTVRISDCVRKIGETYAKIKKEVENNEKK